GLLPISACSQHSRACAEACLGHRGSDVHARVQESCEDRLTVEGGGTMASERVTIRYLALPEVAEHLGLAVGTLHRYRADGRLPPPDAQIGSRQVGWTRETIDAWKADRPGRGRRARIDRT